MTRLRCYVCGTRKPEEDTTLISAKVGGNYRRASRNGQVRVCRECTLRQVEYAREQQSQNLSTAVNSGRMKWEQAAKYFNIPLSGLLIDRMTGRMG